MLMNVQSALVQVIPAQNAKLDMCSTLIRRARRLVALIIRPLSTEFASCARSLATSAVDQSVLVKHVFLNTHFT